MSKPVTCTITARCDTMINGLRVPKGYVMAKITCRDPEAMLFLRSRLGWSHWEVQTNDLEAAKAAAATAKAKREAFAKRPKLSDDERREALADLCRVTDLGEKTADHLIDYYHVISCHQLAACLADERSVARLIADDEVQISAKDLQAWAEQLEAEILPADAAAEAEEVEEVEEAEEADDDQDDGEGEGGDPPATENPPPATENPPPAD